MTGALLFIYAESPLHPGGSESIGGIDLPIQREAATRLPTIWGSSLKGALRERVSEELGAAEVTEIFGSPPRAEDLAQGQLAVGDARLVAFPVPTLQRSFAWATSPLALSRVARLAQLLVMACPGATPAVAAGAALTANDDWTRLLAIGDGTFTPGLDQDVVDWANWLADQGLPATEPFAPFREKLRTDLVLVGEGDLSELTRECIELTARVALKSEEKSVDQGPWFEEHLPAETLLVSPLRWLSDGAASRYADDLAEVLDGRIFVLGGNETVGKGLAWCRLVAGDG